jgi:transcriptional regulator of arginine metabolism
VLGDWVVDVASSANIVVIRTPPGSAHVVASALDRSALGDEIIGTVAGDDTILAVAAETVGGSKLAKRLSDLAGL